MALADSNPSNYGHLTVADLAAKVAAARMNWLRIVWRFLRPPAPPDRGDW